MEVVQQVLAILLVFGLLAVTVWTLRRGSIALPGAFRRARGNSRSLESVERISLTAQHSVHLLRVNGRELVVMTHPQGCSSVSHSHDPARISLSQIILCIARSPSSQCV